MTPTPILRTIGPLLVLAAALTFRPHAVRAAVCVGDCNADDAVTVEEIVTGTQIVLGADASLCPSFDVDSSGSVTIDEILVAVGQALEGCDAPLVAPAPPLLAADPRPGTNDVPRTAWFRLEFGGVVDPSTLHGFHLTCGSVRAYAVSARVVVINPVGEMPADRNCRLTWPGPLGTGTQAVQFKTAPAGPVATVLYDRTVASKLVPFPDDIWTKPDTTAPSGVRVSLPNAVTGIFRVFLREMNKLDGFSPVGHIVLQTSDAPDPRSLPQTATASLDPLASMGLFDIDPASPQFGQRVPFLTEVRTDTNTESVVSHSILIYPSIPLTPGGRYGLVVTRRAQVDPTRPLDPSTFFSAAIGEAAPGEAAEVTQARPLAEEVLDVVAQTTPPIPPDDVALALRISVRTVDSIPADLLAIKEQILAADPPAFSVGSVEPGTGDVAAIVHGTWQAPDWRNDLFFKRGTDGRPIQAKTNAINFTLALPNAALQGSVPVVMYQHGNPGSSEAEVPSDARRYLAAAGYAVIGFTDNLNREVSRGEGSDDAQIAAQVSAIFFGLINNRRVPDYWTETNAEQLAFIRMIPSMGTIDVLPMGAPDGVPDLDVNRPLLYVGISQGANHAPALLPYAPEIRAAALIAGGGRLAETLLHQQPQAFIDTLGPVFPELTATDIWVGLALFQALYDPQESHIHGRFIYRDPLTVAGTTRKASILLVEGLQDSLVPNNATDSLAWNMGPLPHLKPVQRSVPFLDTVDGPVVANIDAQTSAAFFQYVPVGVEGIDPTPGCVVLSPTSAHEGHYCAQGAAESQRQRVAFFRSALEETAPQIINPFE